MPRDEWGMRYAPDLSAPSIAVDFADVRAILGLKPDDPLHILSDLDRTLRVTHGTEIEPEIAAHLREQLLAGIMTSLTITTNTFDADFEHFGLQISNEVRTFGPLNLGIKKQNRKFSPTVISRLGIAGEATIVVGDKVRRDIIGAHRAGLYSMLVSPLGSQDLWFDAWGLRKLDDLALKIGSRAVKRQKSLTL
jgi:predicted HAD superfamily phosphohydrolase YqeG